MTAPGTRRPQEGQCRFCDLGRRGHREGCPQVEIDAVTARALAAEAALADAGALERAHGLLAAAWWAHGELDRYERAHGDTPVMEWSDFDRGYRLAVQNVLAALSVIDPARHVVDDGSRFCAEEAPRGG